MPTHPQGEGVEADEARHEEEELREEAVADDAQRGGVAARPESNQGVWRVASRAYLVSPPRTRRRSQIMAAPKNQIDSTQETDCSGMRGRQRVGNKIEVSEAGSLGRFEASASESVAKGPMGQGSCDCLAKTAGAKPRERAKGSRPTAPIVRRGIRIVRST